MGGGNDKWIAFLAWTLFSFIAISSQVFVFWPWLFGSWTTSSRHTVFIPMNPIEALDPLENGLGIQPLGGVEEGSIGESSNGPTFGYLSVMWANLNVRALLYLVPFNCSLVMLCWNYYLTMTTNPGSPPLDWVSAIQPCQLLDPVGLRGSLGYTSKQRIIEREGENDRWTWSFGFSPLSGVFAWFTHLSFHSSNIIIVVTLCSFALGSPPRLSQEWSSLSVLTNDAHHCA